MTYVALIASLIVCLAPVVSVEAQQKPPVASSLLCTRDNAIDTTKQQLLLTRTFDNPVQRIAVLLRAADLLWPHEQDKAMSAFIEAFDLAVQNFKEHGDQTRRTSQSKIAAVIALPDQRFKVIFGIAKRDPVTAQKLSEKILQDEARDAADKPAADDQSMRRAEKILTVATRLAATDATSAVGFARQSFRYPATMYLSFFLYELAKANKQAADQLYVEALAVYGASPMDQFLYLSSYPFGNTREAGEMPGTSIYRIPDGFVANRALQRQFTQALLARIESAMELPVERSTTGNYTDHAQMWLALNRLEKQIQSDMPDLFDFAIRSRDKLFTFLNPTLQQRVNAVIYVEKAPAKFFDERVEAAEKHADVDRRDQELTMAVMGSLLNNSVERIISVIDKISDTNVRASLLNWVYHFRAQQLMTDKNLSEARKFANKITELDQRAYLYTRIVQASLMAAEDQTEARDLLNEISVDIAKAPKTIVSARALLALAYLYSKIDTNRGVEELGNAVKTINALESPDFSQEFVMIKIEGKTFGSYASFATPGFNPENAFRQMGKLDFDGSLTQATNFTDKSLRSLTTLSVIEPCFAAKRRKSHK